MPPSIAVDDPVDYPDTFVNRFQFLRRDFFTSKCANVLQGPHEVCPAVRQRINKRITPQNASKSLQCPSFTPCVNELLECLKQLLIVHSASQTVRLYSASMSVIGMLRQPWPRTVSRNCPEVTCVAVIAGISFSNHEAFHRGCGQPSNCDVGHTCCLCLCVAGNNLSWGAGNSIS